MRLIRRDDKPTSRDVTIGRRISAIDAAKGPKRQESTGPNGRFFVQPDPRPGNKQ